ncbi:MAG: hypothetical protein FJW38_20945 [Acidobacteria bacterium]|nr:hypothetical protein [Acidobacteriota bacterium]
MKLLLFTCTAFAQLAPFTVVSSATYQQPLAPGQIVTGFSAAVTAPVDPGTYTVIAGTTAIRPFAAAMGQINFVLPSTLPLGDTPLTLRRNEQTIGQTTVRLNAVAPALFTADSSGKGAPAGLLLRVNRDGTRTNSCLFAEPVSRPAPFDPTGETYLLLFGTGMRGRRGEASATIGATSIPVLGLAAQGEFAGLDQINLGPVPEALATRLGEQELRITIDGVAANTVMIAPSRPAFGEWASRARLPLANSEMSVAEAGGKIYVIGGYPAARNTVDDVQVYDTVLDTWTLGPKLPAPVNHSMPAVAGGKIYIAGGQSDAGNSSFVATMYEFDPATQTWRTRAPMPRPRGGGAAAALDGKIYVAGGRPPGGAEFAVYDPAADRWTELPAIPTQRNHLAVIAFGGKIYVIGGRVEAGFQSRVLDTVEVFDPVTNSWSNAAPLPRPRGGLNAVEANGCIHVFGGEGNTTAPNGVFPDHDVFNPRTNTWTRLNDLPIPVHGVTGLAFVNGLIYLPGGGTSQGGSSGGTQHQVYRPAQDCR